MAVVEGMQKLLDSMEALPLTMQRRIIVRALREGSKPIELLAEHLAPRDEGQLAESMSTEVSEQTADGAVAKIGPSRKGFYGFIQEEGLAHNPAQPFLRPAFDEGQQEAVHRIGVTLGDEIEKELKKL